jgi:hypothetical protein
LHCGSAIAIGLQFHERAIFAEFLKVQFVCQKKMQLTGAVEEMRAS